MPRIPVKVRGLFLNITTKCNMQCIDCYGHLDPFPKSDMDLTTAKRATYVFFNNRIREDLRKKYGCIIMFWGGEPTLNLGLIKNYLPWVTKHYPTEKMNYRFAITTNGINLSSSLMELLRKYEVEIFVSIDGPEDIYTERRKVKHEQFEKLISNIKKLVEMFPKELLAVYVVIREENLGQIDRIFSYLYDLGIRRFAISKDFYELRWKYNSKKVLYNYIEKMKAQYPETSFLFYPESAGGCVACYPKYMMVYPNGETYDLCFTCGTVLHRVGLLKPEDLKVFYFGNIYRIDKLYLDISKKKRIMWSKTFCPVIQRVYNDRVTKLM